MPRAACDHSPPMRLIPLAYAKGMVGGEGLEPPTFSV